MLSWRSEGTYKFTVPRSSAAGLQATGSPRVQGCGYGKEACHTCALVAPLFYPLAFEPLSACKSKHVGDCNSAGVS